ncbi:MAG: M42 family metallopeptidase [Candidatus Latescibacteria bacterium]|nr:M42 family metallopeptidase [Candidatus Latescibacterota bacterium]
MTSKSLSFLKALLEAPSPSGFEQPAQKVWRENVGPHADRIETDMHGNCIGIKNEGGSPRVLLAGHCDELGFMIQYITDEGFLHFRTIGGFDVNIIPGRRVCVHTKNGPILGVTGKKAIHVMTDEERKKKAEIHDLWIDIGVKDKKEAESLVSVGDPVTYTVAFEKLRRDLAVSRAFDDKAGSFAVGEVLRMLSGKPFKAAVYSVSTVQEEVGLRGAHTSAYGIDPKVGIAVDVTHATDHPDMDKKRVGDIKLGAGPAISRGANINPVVERMLIQTAEEEKIPYQIEAAPRGTGTDANAIQLTRAGVATGLISIPLRYMHTAVETVSLKDVENVAKLLTAFILRVDDGVDFTP